MNAGDRQDASSLEGLHDGRHQSAGGCKEDGAVHLVREISRVRPDPSRPHRPRHLHMVLAARHHEGIIASIQGDLENDVGRRAEPDEQQLSSIWHTGAFEGTVADDAGT